MVETTREKIRRKRKFLGLTQEELGKRSGLSTMSIRRYESGERVPNYSTIKKIADGLGCDILELLEPHEESEMIIRHVTENLFVSFSSPDEKINYYLNQLNDEGKRVAVERVQELTEIAKYRRDRHES